MVLCDSCGKVLIFWQIYYLQAVNFGSSAVTLKISVDGLDKSIALSGKTKIVLTSDNVMDENSFKEPTKVFKSFFLLFNLLIDMKQCIFNPLSNRLD